MFAADDLTDDGFLGGRLRVLQPRSGYRAATDPVFLAAAVAAQPGQAVLELGCGAGVASLCLAARVPGLVQAGLELQPAYADLARQNAARNGLPLEVLEGDLAAMPALLRARCFDHVIANPPFYPAGGGTACADPGRETAQREATPLADWVAAGLRRLHPGGWLTIIQEAHRLPDLLVALSARTGSITALPLVARIGRPAGRVIVQARKGGRGRFTLAPPLVLHDGAAHDGDRENHSDMAAAILRKGAALEIRAGGGASLRSD
ncbi:methyltransferase [Frigidibacter albus]|uniref:Methyltransferase n=1 Tax=Frigidibacter albus TaxID=1465486 RepID=A0A6L8VBZ9_9RHOB|nr:methyltransferase [Frigidibacter albus]MZQ87848.1 methyltransferase [Frigidibacter albus]NBE29754.1 methyltransferase [Frigidibacter albus]GGH42944.1 methyltransferase [Frigidibacter albus]